MKKYVIGVIVILILASVGAYFWYQHALISSEDHEIVDQSSKVEEKPKDPIEIQSATAVRYSDDISSDYGVFYSFTNTTDQNILIESMDATFKSSDGVVLITDYTNFAPNILKPGETGYGGGLRYDKNDQFPTEGVTVEIEPKYSYNSTKTDPLICSDSNIIDMPFDSLEINHLGVEVTVENTDEVETITPDVVVGLYDEENNLVGYAHSTSTTAIPPGSKAIENCGDILVSPDMDLSIVTTLDARAKPGY